jgi:2-keto-4-pentenoate hydratase/2-oxohepta-3-ene-1,7-dioic acid hydratase in catechol pathway
LAISPGVPPGLSDHRPPQATWIHELSNYSTLYPGDVLWMGTQGADGDMFPGDTIEVDISGIGTLRNYVVAEE